jgi:hypothetical protein
MVKLLTLLILLIAGTAQAQVAIGDSQMDAWRQMRGFGLHLDSVVVKGKVKSYTADSIRIARLLNHVTIFLDNSQRVEKMIFDARDIDSTTFADKYAFILVSPKITRRIDDGNLLQLRLHHSDHVTDIIYDRKEQHIRCVESVSGSE